MKTAVALGIIAMAAIPLPASAGCTWTFDCTSGQCRHVPLCDSTLDIAPPRPAAIAPIPAPTIPPIAAPTIPPIGTRSCSPRYVCGAGGCIWQTVCQ
jgi:hypothetical protein